MDIRELKQQSDLSYDTAVAKRNALEKAHARQVLAYDGHLFRADPQTICLVRTLKEKNGKFFERNQEALNTYHQMYETFTRKGE